VEVCGVVVEVAVGVVAVGVVAVGVDVVAGAGLAAAGAGVGVDAGRSSAIGLIGGFIIRAARVASPGRTER
jgi:hypothetical protein